MKIATFDTTKFDKVARILEMLARISRGQANRKGEWLYYSLLADSFRKVQRAKEEGKCVVAHTIFIPTELFFAMDIVPMYLEGIGEIMARMLGLEEAFATAKSAGFGNEICSGHRLLNAQAIKGWLPRPDAFVWSNQVCDVTAKTGDFLTKTYDRPGYYLDRPYRYSKDGERYFVQELQGLVRFLEELTGRKMDWHRLSEVMEQTRRSAEVFREICALRKNVPSPMRNQHLIEMILAQLLLSGSPELVNFYEVIRDETREALAKSKRDSTQEKYRLMTFFFYPSYLWKLLETMEIRYHAVVVTEPHLSEWADADIDPAKPLESLAGKAFALDDTGPLKGHFLDKVLREAREYSIDGALYWAHIGCRQTCPTIRIIKDALAKEDVPTLVIDCDLADSSYSSEEQMTAKLEQFFELLDENR